MTPGKTFAIWTWHRGVWWNSLCSWSSNLEPPLLEPERVSEPHPSQPPLSEPRPGMEAQTYGS